MSAAHRSSLRYLVGPLTGFFSFFIGYGLIYLLAGREIEESLAPIETVLQLFEAEPIATWRVVGWLFYSAHFIETRISAQFGPVETTTYVDLISQGSGNMELFYLVPPLVLVAAGFSTVLMLAIDDIAEGATFGASITAGYLIAVALGFVLFAYGDTRPDPVPALIIAGVIYPAVFGGLGGAVAALVNDRR